MNRTEHLLTIMSEECNEVAQRITKSLRFGLDETQKDQHFTNRDRIIHEFVDLMSVFSMLVDEENFEEPEDFEQRMVTKKANIEKYLEYSKQLGTLI